MILKLLSAILWAHLASAQTPTPPPPPEVAAPPPGARFSVRDFGAIGDGRADDSAAFQKAFDAIAGKKRVVLFVPAGEYRFAQRVAVDITDIGLTIQGEGQGVSCLLGDNPEGILRIHDAYCKSQVTLRDFSCMAVRQGAGVAIEVSAPPRGARNYRTLLVEHVEMRGMDIYSHFYFSHGIRALCQWRPLFLNVIFAGITDPKVKSDVSDNAPRYRSQCGIQADGCYAPSFQHCYVWSAHTGYQVVTLGRPEGPEDSSFHRAFAVECRVGIDINTPIIEPQLVIDSCHLNCRDVGIRLSNRKFFHITKNLMYSGGCEHEYPYTDMVISNCYAGIIAQNIFHSPAPENTKAAPPVDRTMIRVDTRSRDLQIRDNIFNAKGLSLETESSGRNITFMGNTYPNPRARPPVKENH
jgi:hypothetical protein